MWHVRTAKAIPTPPNITMLLPGTIVDDQGKVIYAPPPDNFRVRVDQLGDLMTVAGNNVFFASVGDVVPPSYSAEYKKL